MKLHTLLVLGTAALTLPVYAQQNTTSEASGESATAARDALKQKDGDTSETTLLKQTLTAVDKQYSLIKRGDLRVTYDLNYTYIGQEKINAAFDHDLGTLTLFNIENDSSHIITNTLSADYGLRDNLTGSVSLPLVSKYSQNSQNSNGDQLSHSIGDLGLGARWQMFEIQRGQPSMTFTTNLRLPTGRSPFKVDAKKGLATGAGVTSASVGINVNHIVDPVALFGSLSITGSLPAKHLSQLRGDVGGDRLQEVAPGMGVGFGIGFAYALSYGISTSFSLQETISAGTKLTYVDANGNRKTGKTNTQTSGVLTLGLGYRVSPKTTVNVTVGIGLTNDSPNLSVGLNMPLSF